MKQKITKTQLDKKIKELADGWRRTQADFENYKKRNEEMHGELIEYAKADFMTKITPVLDNFRRAFEHAPKNNEWFIGVRQIEKQLEDILTSEGLIKIRTSGEKFDPALHEAISCEENIAPIDTIINEVESGWQFNGKVIKPAKVRVSKGK